MSGNCLAVSQTAVCMLRDRFILGPDHQAQPHIPAPGRMNASATQALSQVGYQVCFRLDRKQTQHRGLPHPGQLKPGIQVQVRAPAVSPGDRQGESVSIASSCPSGRV